LNMNKTMGKIIVIIKILISLKKREVA